MPDTLFCIDKDTTACFSGHRPDKLFGTDNPLGIAKDILFDMLIENIDIAYKKGCVTFLCGMAKGFDLIAGDAVLHYRKVNKLEDKIRIIGVSPYRNEIKSFHGDDLIAYQRISSAAEEMIYLSEDYNRSCFHMRNNFMVDNSSVLICACADFKSGTGATISYAAKKKLSIQSIDLSIIHSLK